MGWVPNGEMRWNERREKVAGHGLVNGSRFALETRKLDSRLHTILRTSTTNQNVPSQRLQKTTR